MMRKFNIKVNGRDYEVEVEEVSSMAPAAPLVREGKPVEASQRKVSEKQVSNEPEKKEPEVKAASEAPSKAETAISDGAETISSPMPGTILSVNVKPGDMVKRGDVLLVLEAMKMENEIMASQDGKVLKVEVQSGASVNTGDVLVVIS